MDEGDFIDITSDFDRSIEFVEILTKLHKENKKKSRITSS